MKKFISFALVLMLAILCLVGCNNSTSKVADNTEHITKVTNTCKLTKSYEGKSFLSDGIGEATIAYFTDGDTFTATLKKETTNVTIRFHSVDTPESTGGIEKWGKAASLFVEQQLSKATKIVLEATSVPAEHDNYGVRYLGYVWYRTDESQDLINLNLELVENGYSQNKGLDTTKFPYNSYFEKAQANAKSIQLRVWSQLDDPLYSTDPVVTTLQDIVENTDKYYNSDIKSGVKVSFNACLTSFDSKRNMFTATYCDRETGKTYAFPIYAGYSSGKNMELGHFYRIVGSLGEYNSSLQISGIKYNAIIGANNLEYTHPIQKNYYLTFSSDTAYIANYASTLYTDATVVSSAVENGVLTIEATATQRTKDGLKDEAVTFTFKVNVQDGFTNNYTAGKKFSVQGYKFDEKTNEITVLKLSDITLG